MVNRYKTVVRGLLSEAPTRREPPVAPAGVKPAEHPKVTFNGFEDPGSKGSLANRTSGGAPTVRATPDPRTPGRVAGPGEADQIRAPQNNRAMNDLMRRIDTADEVSDDIARLHAGIVRRAQGDAGVPPRALPRPRQLELPAPDEDEDLRPAPDEPRNQLVLPNRLPDVIARDTHHRVNITWHPVPSLPHYVINQIRAAFRPLFRQMLNADLEELSVATDLHGAGTGREDMDRLWNFLLSRGQVDDNFNLEAFGIDPREYNVPEAYIVHFGGNAYYLMTEKHGALGGVEHKYIYVAPGKGRGTRLGGPEGGPRQIARESALLEGTFDPEIERTGRIIRLRPSRWLKRQTADEQLIIRHMMRFVYRAGVSDGQLKPVGDSLMIVFQKTDDARFAMQRLEGSKTMLGPAVDSIIGGLGSARDLFLGRGTKH